MNGHAINAVLGELLAERYRQSPGFRARPFIVHDDPVTCAERLKAAAAEARDWDARHPRDQAVTR